MNNLPAVIKVAPEWFLGEVEDLLELLKASDSKKKHYFFGMDEFEYIYSLPKRLFQCGYIGPKQLKTFNSNIRNFSSKSKNSVQFLLKTLFYVYQSGLLNNNITEFKNTRDTLIAVVKKVTKTQELTAKKVSAIMSIDKKVFPEVLPGEVVGHNGEIVDTIYQELESKSDAMIALLQADRSNFQAAIVDIYGFYSELLHHGYINNDIYSYLMTASGSDIETSICTGLIHALSAGFYDHEPDTKECIMYITNEYFKDNREKSLQMWADEIFNGHGLTLPNNTTSP